MTTHRRGDSFMATARGLGVAWLALLTLMAASLGSAYLNLGAGNVIAGLGIAVLKTVVVAWWFMRLRAESGVVRLAALAAIFMLLVLAMLSGVDYATRLPEPAAVQAPRQLEPLARHGPATGSRTEGTN